MAIIRAVDEASKIIEKINASFDSLGAAADRAAEQAKAAGSVIDESLLQTASGADALAMACMRMRAAEQGVVAATDEQAAAEDNLKNIMAASVTTDKAKADALERLQIATDNVTKAQAVEAAEVERYNTIQRTLTAQRLGAIGATSKLTDVSAKYASTVDGLWNVSKYATIGVAAIGYESVKTAMSFQQSMTMIRTQAHDTTDNIKDMGNELIALAPKVGIGPNELAQSLYHVASAGIFGKQALDAVRQAAMGTQIGAGNLESTTQAMIAVMSSGIGVMGGMGNAMASLNAIVGTGDMRMSQLTAAMGTGILPAAKSAGLTLTDVGAALATLTDNATPANEAATRLKTTFSMMAGPSQQAQKALRLIGMTGTQMADDMRKPNGLLVALQDLKDHLNKPITGNQFTGSVKGTTTSLENLGLSAIKSGDLIGKMGIGGAQAVIQLTKFGLTVQQAIALVGKLGPNAAQQGIILSKAFGGGRTSASILTLLGEMDKLKSKYPAITQGAKSFGSDWAKTTQTAVFQGKSLKASVEAVGTSLGTALLPMVQKLLGYILQILGPMVQWVTTHQKLAAQILMVVVGIIALVGALKMIMTVAEAFSVVMALLDVEMDANPIGLVITAIALLVIGIIYAWNHFKIFRQVVETVWNALKTAFTVGWTVIKAVFNAISTAVMFVWHAMQAAFNGIIGAAKAVWNALVATWNAIVDVTTSVWDGIVGFFKKWWPLLLLIFAAPIAILIGIWNHFHSQIEAVAKAVWGAIKWFFVQTWDGIKMTAQTAWNLIKDFIIKPIQAVWNWMQPFIHTMMSFLSTMWNAGVSAVKAIWSFMYKWVIKPLVDAWNFLVSFVKSFLQIGEDIINGIISGLEAGWNWLTKTVSNLANDALKVAKSVLGIGSPSKRFADEVGKWIPHGIAKGINDHAHMVHDAVNKLTKGLPGVAINSASELGTINSKLTISPANLSTNSLAATGPGAGPAVLIDMRGSQLMSDKDYDVLADKLGRRIATRILPAGGVRIRM